MTTPLAHRRPLLRLACVAAASLALPALASSRRAVMPPMTDGPFYPPRAWRERLTDWDADLTRVQRGGQVLTARGEALGLELTVADTDGRLIDAAEVEIWQCDALGAYRHPNVSADAAQMDAGFQGFGAARSDVRGALRFRTIRPVNYPGRTPHIHVKVLHPAFGAWTSQLFVAGDPGNAGDFLWRSLAAADREALEMKLLPADTDNGLRWVVRQQITLPA